MMRNILAGRNPERRLEIFFFPLQLHVKNLAFKLSWWEETGENAPASWVTSKGDSLHGSMEKAKPRPK
ncbi:hypothetical protein ABH14_12460 [Brevibacillus brevis]|uniref:hypothetical protein n=1 Tax=Brevibacillus brevis TaxID=1393 RepID=UPI0018FF566E|nr:hypothetical protein [Brevibacillus brevis]MBH0330598.1 hypothetical protein [Brevibacillus brevis]